MDRTKYLTKEKYQELEKELIDLKTVKRKEVSQNLEYARALGDLSENAEYQEARELQATIEDRIASIENTLKYAEIVSDIHEKSDFITMGSEVSLEKENGDIQKFKIVGSDEVNMAEGKISNESPIGFALLGKKKGDKVEIKTPKGAVVYKVKSFN